MGREARRRRLQLQLRAYQLRAQLDQVDAKIDADRAALLALSLRIRAAQARRKA